MLEPKIFQETFAVYDMFLTALVVAKSIILGILPSTSVMFTLSLVFLTSLLVLCI